MCFKNLIPKLILTYLNQSMTVFRKWLELALALPVNASLPDYESLLLKRS